MDDVKHDKIFYLKDGNRFSNLKGFAKELKNMPRDVYEHHVNPHKNDFSNWLSLSLNNKSLAVKIEKHLNKIETELEILRHLVHDEEKKIFKKKVKKQTNKK